MATGAGGLTSEQVIKLVTNAGLRGIGAAPAYPTARSWARAQPSAAWTRHLVANGFEADPDAGGPDPHGEPTPTRWSRRGARRVGDSGTDAIIAVNARATLATERLRGAIDAAAAKGYWASGDGHGSPLRIEVRPLSGSFVLGEETVLLRALEDRRAQPDQRPPHPATKGLWGEPTVVNNVETLAAVPWIVANGAGAYAAIGSSAEPGTTLVQLSGAVRDRGVAEVPMGTPLRDIIDTVGGGAQGTLKAVLVGGPSGGFLPPDALDTPLGHAELDAVGAILGSGTLLVIDDTTCLVDLASLLTRFCNDEACGSPYPAVSGPPASELGARSLRTSRP